MKRPKPPSVRRRDWHRKQKQKRIAEIERWQAEKAARQLEIDQLRQFSESIKRILVAQELKAAREKAPSDARLAAMKAQIEKLQTEGVDDNVGDG